MAKDKLDTKIESLNYNGPKATRDRLYDCMDFYFEKPDLIRMILEQMSPNALEQIVQAWLGSDSPEDDDILHAVMEEGLTEVFGSK